MLIILLAAALIVTVWYFARSTPAAGATPVKQTFGVTDRVLRDNIAFYRALGTAQQQQFQHEVQEFLEQVTITGVKTAVDNTDRILVAASAVIPVFSFPDWTYHNLEEVLLYEDSFNMEFETAGHGRNIQGMVGSGFMEGKMLLSIQALREGFKNETDKNNTAIHEFVHLIDKADGAADGLPELLLLKQYTLPWLDMLYTKMKEIAAEESDINPYGLTNKAEFFAVAAEYFFERPDLLQQKHPGLFRMLQQLFQQAPEVRWQPKKAKTGRNDCCYCGSGLKYKDCCWQKDQQLPA